MTDTGTSKKLVDEMVDIAEALRTTNALRGNQLAALSHRVRSEIERLQRELYLLRNERDNLADNVHRLSNEPGTLHKKLEYFAAEAIRYAGYAEVTDWSRVNAALLSEALSSVLCKLQSVAAPPPRLSDKPAARKSPPGGSSLPGSAGIIPASAADRRPAGFAAQHHPNRPT